MSGKRLANGVQPMKLTKSKLKKIILEELQTILQEQRPDLKDIQDNLDANIKVYNDIGQTLGGRAYANKDFIKAASAIKNLSAEKQAWLDAQSTGGMTAMDPEQISNIQWQNFLEAYPPGSIEQGAIWDPASGKSNWPLRDSVDEPAYSAASRGDIGYGSLVHDPAWATRLGQYTDAQTGLPGIRESRINEASDALIQDLINLISDESVAIEVEREMGPEAYSDWLAAYKDPYHPEHDEAKAALPAIDPANPDFMYPAKSARYHREWDRLTSGEEVVE